YHATVILAIERVSEKSRGRIYVYGSVKGQGPQEIPADESYTVSKAIIRAGGFGDFANKRKVKVTRKNGQDFTIDLKRVIEEGRTDEDMVLQPDDQIYVRNGCSTCSMNVPVEVPGSSPWSTAFFRAVYCYKSLLLRRGWVLALTLCCGLF